MPWCARRPGRRRHHRAAIDDAHDAQPRAARSRTVEDTRPRRPCAAATTRAGLHRNTRHLAAGHFALAGVHARADLQAERRDGIADRAGATHTPRRAVEGRRRSHRPRCRSPCRGSGDLVAGALVVALQQLTPLRIAERGGMFGRADDVGEDHRRQHTVAVRDLPDPGQELLDLVGQGVAVADQTDGRRPAAPRCFAPGRSWPRGSAARTSISLSPARCSTRSARDRRQDRADVDPDVHAQQCHCRTRTRRGTQEATPALTAGLVPGYAGRHVTQPDRRPPTGLVGLQRALVAPSVGAHGWSFACSQRA